MHLTVASSDATAGGLLQQMDSLFGSMSNSTPPGVWETQRRGVFQAGQLTVKNRIVNENLISFVPPSFSAGCGGIDLFGGSFSFINADQFVQLLRGIAANAAGYAFQLALGAMCPECASIIEQIQKKIQELNQFFGNSCQVAQGIVNDTLGAAIGKQDTEASKISFTKGLGDIFESWTLKDGKSPTEKASEHAPKEFAEKVQGNIVWRALKKQAVSGWFVGGDEDLLEAIMSITGTVIVGEMQDAGDGKKEPKYSSFTGNKIRFQDLLEGTGSQTIQVLRCDERAVDKCLNPSMQPMTIKGFQRLIYDKLLNGENGTPGLVYRIAANQGSLSDADKAFLSPQKFGLAGLIFKLCQQGTTGAEALADQAIPHLAFDLAVVMINDMIKSVDSAVKVSDDPHMTDLQQILKNSRDQLYNEERLARDKIGSPIEIYKSYMTILEISQKIRYALTGK